MLVTENLAKEHRLILKYVDLMVRYSEVTQKHPENPILLEKASCFIGFIEAFADHFHHAKEEDILFRYLQIPGVLTHCNPVPQMLMEHDKAREYVRNIKQALQVEALNVLVDNIAGYARLLKEHIHKEDNILYPMTERGLSDKAKAELLKECAETDERLDSQAMWDKYQALFVALELKLEAPADLL